MTNSLVVEWIDPRGKTWNLTTGEQGVIFDMGQQGLGWSTIQHATARSGQRILSSTLERAVHNLAISLDPERVGMPAYELREEWWYKANSPYDYGTLKFTRPDGVVRTRRLKLADTPDTKLTYDPGIGAGDVVEVWPLTGNGPWWEGVAQEHIITYADLTGGNDTPFYGADGTAYPFYISRPFAAQGVTIDNTGQGPMWLTWELTGPMTDPVIGFDGGALLQYKGVISAGEKITIITDPEYRRVIDGDGMSMFGYLYGRVAPTPKGQQVPLVFTAQAIGAATRAVVTGVTRYAAPF
ncbi:minor tail protein [Corynebacterium phage EmiRose]|uniref:Minor tail protein n=1 Tax=Corynebacterium phage EmiRose TaxID=2565372 RepID=A0A649VPA3_9CAUD|nr:minor tail protein [Corynebacterium phage EmiRose]QGJ94148.1 minor tail protein [Corynebacterium phage EmiRose]